MLDLLAFSTILSTSVLAATPEDWRVNADLVEEVAADDAGETVFFLHRFVERRLLPDSLFSITRRSGFAISILMADEAKPQLVWTRPYVGIHVPGEWEPIHHIGSLWWDDRINTLWIASAITTQRQSMIHVDQLVMARDKETDPLGPSEFSQQRFQINHKRGEADRIVRIDISPMDDQGIRLEIIHQGGDTSVIAVLPSERRMPAEEASERLFGFVQQVNGLAEAIQQDVSRSSRFPRPNGEEDEVDHTNEFQKEQLAEYTLTDAETDQSIAVFKLWKYFDSRGLGDGVVKAAEHPRRGYVVTIADAALSDELEVLWGRRLIAMHLREPPTEVASIWWDERHNLLWIILVMSVTEQSVAEIHAIPLAKDDDTGAVWLAEEESVTKTTKTIQHPRGEPDRITEVTIRPERVHEVVLGFGRYDESVHPTQVTVDRRQMTDVEGIALGDISELIRRKQ